MERRLPLCPVSWWSPPPVSVWPVITRTAYLSRELFRAEPSVEVAGPPEVLAAAFANFKRFKRELPP